MIDNYILYDKQTKFSINPKMDAVTANNLNIFMDTISTHLFWSFDIINNCICINESNNCVHHDIFGQLLEIHKWLNKYGYTLTGSVYYRTENSIEFVTIDSIVSHYILYDPVDDLSVEPAEMFMAKNKLASKMEKMDSRSKGRLNGMWPRKNLLCGYTVDSVEPKVEIINQTKFVKKNYYQKYIFWKICSLISCFTLASYMLCTARMVDQGDLLFME